MATGGWSSCEGTLQLLPTEATIQSSRYRLQQCTPFQSALRTGPWIQIWCGLGSRSKDHFASIQPPSGSELYAVLHDSAPGQCANPVQQWNAHSLYTVWSSLENTLNQDPVNPVSVPECRAPFTPTYSSHSSTVLYETYIVGLDNLEVQPTKQGVPYPGGGGTQVWFW